MTCPLVIYQSNHKNGTMATHSNATGQHPQSSLHNNQTCMDQTVCLHSILGVLCITIELESIEKLLTMKISAIKHTSEARADQIRQGYLQYSSLLFEGNETLFSSFQKSYHREAHMQHERRASSRFNSRFNPTITEKGVKHQPNILNGNLNGNEHFQIRQNIAHSGSTQSHVLCP